ncbi:DeoR/GlpR family DNA-binding transcription regulator [Tepidimicrobium xylanilyticum]|uniref:Transcriptional regulator, DeoR family n=1 Tax=Tepidimicrobium xylanilyticum TaxID=1123352 RepID=A0A1H2RPJ7_9FIRM|nr:DeoR/GlpR family DNA-binding transcription regulator [Tepidimicrobium xylanilyticum]GMG95365.1 transcriptional regulator [Tepidimicrobium xylanilyticum]SDW21392.1 transcriptional regulator, DeoR family [Tepidimicrobium xylanilyticum]
MKNNMNIVNSRREKIMNILKTERSIKVADLSEILEVSPLTIRRDLEYLAKLGLIERFHGGANLVEEPIDKENMILSQKKNAIAKKAAEFINDNETIFINSSSTALLTLQHLKDKRVTVITNNGKALGLDIDSKISLVLTGGDIKFPKAALSGEFAISNLSKVTATRSIIGVSGLSFEMGLTSFYLDEVAVNQLMLTRVSEGAIVVTDSSKLGRNETFVSGEISTISMLITDRDADRAFVEKLEKMGIQVILVDY